jgi:hypothetical protein
MLNSDQINLNMEETFLKSLAWTDSRLGLLFSVLIPLVLLIWAARQQIPSIQRLLIIYWRVASLWMITVYLLIPVWGIGYLTGLASRILIPISLWFWVDINDEIRDLPKSKLKLGITSWRWAMTLYCVLGAIANVFFVPCAFASDATAQNHCRIWLQAPWQYKSLMHPNATTGFLGFLGMTGLIIYLIYFFYFLLFRLIKQGRIALEQ